MPGEYLFNEGSTLDLARQLPEKAMEELKAYPEGVFLSTSIEDTVAALVEKYHPGIPQLDEEGVWVEEKEETYQPRYDRGDYFRDSFGTPGPQRCHLVVFHLPFSGDGG